jgi:hypothetical protein
MMEPIRLWSDNQGDSFSDDQLTPDDVEYAALPRADFDALTERIEKLRDEGFAMYAAYNAATARANTATVAANLMRARADTASAKLAQAEALLREAAGLMFDRDLFPVCNDAAPLRWRERVAPIIDTNDAPTPDDPDESDRRGEDGAWCERGTE